MSTRYVASADVHATNRLTQIWTQASSADRALITRASNRIDAELSEDADQKGIPLASVSPTLRYLDISPLRVYFHALVAAQIALIIDYERIP